MSSQCTCNMNISNEHEKLMKLIKIHLSICQLPHVYSLIIFCILCAYAVRGKTNIHTETSRKITFMRPLCNFIIHITDKSSDTLFIGVAIH